LPHAMADGLAKLAKQSSTGSKIKWGIILGSVDVSSKP
jgi:putative amino acid transporter